MSILRHTYLTGRKLPKKQKQHLFGCCFKLAGRTGHLTRPLRVLSRKPSGFRGLSSARENSRFLPFPFESRVQTQQIQKTSVSGGLLYLAGRTGLEPATSAVTGQCSNQLNYRPRLIVERLYLYFAFLSMLVFWLSYDICV